MRTSSLTPFCLIPVLVGAAGATEQPQKVWREPLTNMPFVRVEKGCFQMGSARPVAPPANSEWESMGYQRDLSENERPAHEVCVDGFWIAQYEVTRDEFAALNATTRPPKTAGRFPASGMSWDAARHFARELGARSGGKYEFRLPTEAEWEYACRAGTPAAELGNEALARTARYGLGTPEWDRFGPNVGEVGTKEPNAFGLYDMLGNVWEWTADVYQDDAYTRHTLYNPAIPESGAQTARVIRGTSFRTEFQQVRCAKRSRQPASEGFDTIGFRLIRVR